MSRKHLSFQLKKINCVLLPAKKLKRKPNNHNGFKFWLFPENRSRAILKEKSENHGLA